MGSFVVMRAATGRSQATAEGSQLRCTAAESILPCLVMLCAAKLEIDAFRKKLSRTSKCAGPETSRVKALQAAADNALLHTIQSKNCFGLHFVF